MRVRTPPLPRYKMRGNNTSTASVASQQVIPPVQRQQQGGITERSLSSSVFTCGSQRPICRPPNVLCAKVLLRKQVTGHTERAPEQAYEAIDIHQGLLEKRAEPNSVSSTLTPRLCRLTRKGLILGLVDRYEPKGRVSDYVL